MIELSADPMPEVTEIDLRDQFDPLKVRQVGGTCHISASTGLFEAACYRRTGSHLGISEAQVYIRHLETALNKKSIFGAKPNEPGFMTSHDGGEPKDDLLLLKNLITSGASCSRETFPLDKDFSGSVQKVLNKSKEDLSVEIRKAKASFARYTVKDDQGNLSSHSRLKWFIDVFLSSVEKEMHDEFSRRNNMWAFDVLKKEAFTPSHEKCEGWLQTDEGKAFNSELKKCLSGNLVAKTQSSPSSRDIRRLLLKKIPVLCNSPIAYENGQEGEHSFIVTGIKKVKHQGELKHMWQIRDSNYAQGDMYANMGNKADALKCEDIIWIEP